MFSVEILEFPDGVIQANHLITSTAVITVAAQIANAIIGNAHIADLSADKITAGTINVQVLLAGSNIEIDGTSLKRILIIDDQGTPVPRVSIGKLGAGSTQWGLRVWDSNGITMFHADDGGITAAGIKAAVIDSTHLRTDTAVISVAAQIANALIINAHIVNLTVDTLKIKGNATSSSIVSEDDTAEAFTNTEETVLSVTINLADVDGVGGTGDVLVWAKCYIFHTNSNRVGARMILKHGTTLEDVSQATLEDLGGAADTNAVLFCMVRLTGLSTGNQTFNMRMTNYITTDTITAIYMKITAQQVKK